MNNTEENKDGIIKLEVTLAYINYPKEYEKNLGIVKSNF